MLSSHKGGKRGKTSTGVADYFAVLGIDSFLPPPPSDDGNCSAADEEEIANDNDNQPSSHANNSNDNNYERSSSMRTEITGNLSSTSKTPKNNNLSRNKNKLVQQGGANVVDSIPEDAPSGDSYDTPIQNTSKNQKKNVHNNKMNSEEYKLHSERFQREIVQLALVTSESETSDQYDADNWSTCDATIPIHMGNGRHPNRGSNSNLGGVKLAYRRRGPLPNNIDDDDDDSDCDSTDDDDRRRNYPQHLGCQYYTPGIANVAIHYAKVRPSTIPNNYFLNSSATSIYDQSSISQQSYPQQQVNTKNNNNATSKAKSLLSGGAAKLLSGGAVKSLGLATAAAVTKEMASGLVNVVKQHTPVEFSGIISTGTTTTTTNNNNNDDFDDAISETMSAQEQREYATAVLNYAEAVSPSAESKTPIRSTRSITSTHATPGLGLYDTGRIGGGSFDNDTDIFSNVDGPTKIWSPKPENMDHDSLHGKREHFFPDSPRHDNDDTHMGNDGILRKPLHTMLPLPTNYDELIIPNFCKELHLPTPELVHKRKEEERLRLLNNARRKSRTPILVDRTGILRSSGTDSNVTSPSSVGMEAMYLSPTNGNNMSSPRSPGRNEGESPVLLSHTSSAPDPNYVPTLTNSVEYSSPNNNSSSSNSGDEHVYIPIVAIRYQRTGENERYNEDPAMVDIMVSFIDGNGLPPKIANEEDEDDEFDDFGRGSNVLLQNVAHADILNKSDWTSTMLDGSHPTIPGSPIILNRHNTPNGFADLPFAAKVLDRFPQGNYRGMPFPEEELPMFCYARGSLLVRDKLRNVGLPKCFGFVVKNERGDSIYVSCLTFYEPLTRARKDQLDELSIRRQNVSLLHRSHCRKMKERRGDIFSDHLVGFDDIITLENKTICLVGRYPYWTEFRRFLTHLHLLSGSSSDIPLERNISHLLLSVPIPKPGGQCVLVPFSTMNDPMALIMPPLKDLPLVDLSYSRLFAALDVPTVVTIVLGFLCLERKVILISTRQTLLLDCCELLKSLLFPFDLCAPYVPYLTQPFMSCLEFPGATFVGIHDDGKPTGLAKIVRDSIPEDSIIVELDSGEINCDGNRYETLKAAYQIIPSSRTFLIKEIEALCQDAGIVPGQEPLDYGVDSAIDSSAPSNMEMFGKHKENNYEPLDDRAVRDNFLRFFCSILGGYERFLVVPDADFLTSGNEWFDAPKFLSIASPSRKPFLGALVETQLWQSFIQRRTEASDVHCVLFDECLAEYHSSNVPYGRLSGNQMISEGEGELEYSLLVDQCATEPDLLLDDDESSFLARSEIYNKSFGNDNDTSTQASSGYAESAISDTSLDRDASFAINASGDIVTIPSTSHLPPGARYLYCIDTNPSFPTAFKRQYFLPKEPDTLAAETSEAPAPILMRSEREREEAIRLCNSTVSRKGPQKQHRCLWQLAKFMGSQFFGTWLMCIPNQLSQVNVSTPEKTKILLRALGALRTLRSHRRIVADEAAYRALIVACGRSGTDRRVELMKLYGLMRTDGIFPNAVTLGQYTRAIAEGYSNMNVDGSAKLGMQVVIPSEKGTSNQGINMNVLDNNLAILEESGTKWRSRGNGSPPEKEVQPEISTTADRNESIDEQDQSRILSPSKTFDTATTTQRSIKTKRTWLPIRCSSSFCLGAASENNPSSTRLFALWSRASSCKACSYVPLDEEIQGGWDVLHNKLEMDTTVACPRCEGKITPLIGYKEMSIVELLESEAADTSNTTQATDLNISGVTQDGDSLQGAPSQLEPMIRDGRGIPGLAGFVTYLSPQKLRTMLEDLVLEYGEEVLDRDRLQALNSEVFFNLWWYSARFSLPLPLAVTSWLNEELPLIDCCAFASWDKTLALQGCRSAAKAIMTAQSLRSTPDRVLHEKLFENPNTDIPLLSFFNLQNYAQGDWDHPDFSVVLVALVKACETRDLLPVVECIYQKNQAREAIMRRNTSVSSFNDASFESAGLNYSLGASTEVSGSSPSAELDYYRTILYLARYQCTTAFHAFFPTTIRACKGYHFWCAQGTSPLPIFDRAFQEAAECYCKEKKLLVPIPSASAVALGFRSVFGHVI